jgi:hypothetical protein
VGVAELQKAWEDYSPRVLEDYGEWDQEREKAAVPHLEALQAFLAGETNLEEFKSRTDSLSKSMPFWGFRGNSQMFFNQLAKGGDQAEVTAALRRALPAPTNADDARDKLEQFQEAVQAARDHAESVGATQPGVGRIDAFVSFFWELQDRERWPVFFPNSRDVLEQHGLLDVNQPQPELYLAYRAAIDELKSRFSADTWTVEHLLWRVGKGMDSTERTGRESDVAEPKPPPSPPATDNLYASYRAQGLHFPDEIVTSLVLSLATKRLVILSGISGTGKTQIALGLARFLEAGSEQPAEAMEAPEQDPKNIYVKVTASKLKRGHITFTKEAREHLDAAVGLPERGSKQIYVTALPNGERHDTKMLNVGFTDPSKELYRLFLRKETAEWLRGNSKPGDYLHFALQPDEGVDIALDVVSGQPAQSGGEADRHATVAVKSEWTDPRGLIGYFNPLTSTYVRSALVELLLKAADDPDNPYLVILDEMNLARVEYYFSDFLSAMESGEPLNLMSPGAADESAANQESADTEVPGDLEIPPNVSFIGTVNVDETTHPFSPKVLDRANVIEFSEVDVERALGHGSEVDSSGLRLKGGELDPSWLCRSKQQSLAPREQAFELGEFTAALEDVHGILAWSNLQFGYRVIEEVCAYVGHAVEKSEGDADEVVRRAFDLQLRQKIVPKLSGGRELELPLSRLLHYCVEGKKLRDVNVDEVHSSARDRLEKADTPNAPAAAYPGTARKLSRMLDRLADTGFIGALE